MDQPHGAPIEEDVAPTTVAIRVPRQGRMYALVAGAVAVILVAGLSVPLTMGKTQETVKTSGSNTTIALGDAPANPLGGESTSTTLGGSGAATSPGGNSSPSASTGASAAGSGGRGPASAGGGSSPAGAAPGAPSPGGA